MQNLVLVCQKKQMEWVRKSFLSRSKGVVFLLLLGPVDTTKAKQRPSESMQSLHKSCNLQQLTTALRFRTTLTGSCVS